MAGKVACDLRLTDPGRGRASMQRDVDAERGLKGPCAREAIPGRMSWLLRARSVTGVLHQPRRHVELVQRNRVELLIRGNPQRRDGLPRADEIRPAVALEHQLQKALVQDRVNRRGLSQRNEV